jgi:IclR helix-turn-helix domain
MSREELTALRDALSLALALPDSVRALLAQWLRDDVPKPNGQDPDPPIARESPKAAATSPANPRIHKPGGSRSTKAAEKRLLDALRESPGQGVNALARASGGAKSTTQLRLKRLEARGAIEKREGRWRIAGEGPGPTSPP